MELSVDIRKKLGNFRLDIRFLSREGPLALFGASGCGKSMTLKCIAGLETPDEGRIVLNGVPLFDSEKRINLPPQRRKTGYLFQNSALFPNMTTAQNILCGMHTMKNKRLRQEKLLEFIKKFRLEGLENHSPSQLSGGQQQKAALARIFAANPDLVLLDEPFSALDSHMKWKLEQETYEILQGFGGSAVLVSHNRDEVFRLCSTIVVIANGAVDSIGGKHEILRHPKTYASCLLSGCKNISKIRKTSESSIFSPDWDLHIQTASTICDTMSYAGIMAHHLEPTDRESGCNSFAYDVEKMMEDTSGYILLIRKKNAPNAQTIRWEMNREQYSRWKGYPKCAYIPPENVLLLR